MLTEGSFIVNHWITILWLAAAGFYTLFAVVQDIRNAKSAAKKAGR